MTRPTFRRRDFLRLTVVSALAAGALPLAGCGGNPEVGPSASGPSSPEDILRVFPQGVASGDPRPDSVILWTRVEPEKGAASKDVEVTYEVAKDEAFTTVVASGTLTAKASADHTVRLKVTDLEAYTTYYYRFTASGVTGDVGRTKTAPEKDADTSVRFAFAACQDFVGRYYHSWKALADEDAVDFVLFLGDYIYETNGDPAFQTPTEARKIVLPDGLDLGDGSLAAKTLADYRALYKQYRSDANLKEIHRRYPFIVIWDDHEFGDDCWGDHTTHFGELNGNTEEYPAQREDADQAWFEYQPADVEYDESASFPSDIKIYRQLRYGKHVDLFLTDQRYFRDDHIIPEGPVDFSVGKIVENSGTGSRNFLLKSGFDPQEAAKKPTMLGATQKQWFVDAVKGSNATWKLWGSETQLAQMLADLKDFTTLPEAYRDTFYISVDQWDGYRTERAEILTALADVGNLVALTGDIHAFYASELHVDFDAPAAKPVAVEYVVAGISSQGIAPLAENLLSQPALKDLGLVDLVPDWDTILVAACPHYKYASSFLNGIGICTVSAAELSVEFLIVKDVLAADFDGTVDRVKFRTVSGSNLVERV